MYLVAEQNTDSKFTSGAVGKAISSKCGSSFASKYTFRQATSRAFLTLHLDSAGTSSFPADVSNTVGSATASASQTGSSAAASSTGAAIGLKAGNVFSASWALMAGVVGMGVVAGGMGVLA